MDGENDRESEREKERRGEIERVAGNGGSTHSIGR